MVDKAAARDGTLPYWKRPWLSVFLYSAAVVALLVIFNLGSTDYVGADNDDAMRLVQVRDLLSGQGWFDLMQYRLGLDGGTLMHWSRLVDLPIAALIAFFGLFTASEQAEALALTVWPLALIVPLLASVGFAGLRMGGPQTMQIALGLGALVVLSSNRFLPGAIDHHNVQMVLVVTMVTMLVDRDRKILSFAVAGAAAALAIAIGAETTPLVALVCIVIALSWAWHGVVLAAATRVFSIAITIATTALFVATVPPEDYRIVTCDSLSLSYYGLVSIGGLLLLLTTFVPASAGRTTRFAFLGLDAVVVTAAALVLAPQCLGGPYSDFDPLVTEIWLNNVSEAQTVWDKLRYESGVMGGFYMPVFFALVVTIMRIIRHDRVEMHLVLLPLLLATFLITLLQVRGSTFATLVAIPPLSLLISDLRANSRRDPEDLGASFTFVLATLLSVPSFWALGGALVTEGTGGLINRVTSDKPGTEVASPDCTSRGSMHQLATLEPSLVVAPIDSGAHILRFTHHSVVTAPYHRNQRGILTELHLGLSTPQEAVAFLRGANADIVAFCPSDTQTSRIIDMNAGGFYAALKNGQVPDYLETLAREPQSGFYLYKVLPDS